MNNYKELKIWQKSVDLSVRVYEVTRSFPKEELYGLASQIRRSAVSIPSNMAEGAGRNSSKDFNNFLGISNGSSCELETQVIIAGKAHLLEQEELNELQSSISEIQRMNRSLQKSLTANTKD